MHKSSSQILITIWPPYHHHYFSSFFFLFLPQVTISFSFFSYFSFPASSILDPSNVIMHYLLFIDVFFFYFLGLLTGHQMAEGTGEWWKPPSRAAAAVVDRSVAEVVVGKGSSVNNDYGEPRCMSDLGLCANEYCDENCCINTCNMDYGEFNPHPMCAEITGQDFRLCLCWYDCHD